MKKSKTSRTPDEPAAEYNFAGGVRGKYAARYRAGTNVVVLEPDVAALFPDAKLVNESLRELGKLIRLQKQRPAV
jgi:hypothetical protein